jgi:hypothetical protein
MPLPRLLLLLFTLLLACARATLHCATTAESVAALRAACLTDLGCRYFFAAETPENFARLVTQRLQLVRDWSSALSAAQSAFHGDDDVRHHFWPAGWRAEPTLVGVGAAAQGDVAVETVNCSALALATGLPPPELRDAVHLLVEYAIFLSDERQCDPESEVPVIDPDTHEPSCMLAANHVCASSTGVDDMLVSVALYLLVTLAAVGILATFALSIYVFRKTARAFPASDRFIPLTSAVSSSK